MPPSKLVADRRKAATAVLASIDTHAAGVAADLENALRPYLRAGEDMPNAELLLRLLGRQLVVSIDALSEADVAHAAELGDDAGFREARDDARRALTSKLTETREILDGVCGSDAMARYGLQPIRGRSAQELVALARSWQEKLLAEALPPARIPVTVDPAKLAADIEATVLPLERSLEDVAREAREAEATLTVRKRAEEAYDEAFSVSANAVAALYRAAGQRELARRVRPSKRRRGRLLEPEAAPQVDETDAADAA